MRPLPATPAAPAAPGGGLLHGLTAGELRVDPVAYGPGRGRRRRWYYVAAADTQVGAGAAVVDLAVVAVAFAWANLDGDVITWERRFPLGRGAWVGPTPRGGAGCRTRRGETILLDADGGLHLDLTIAGERLRADVHAVAGTPAVAVTPTPGGGWNTTQKEAGQRVTGTVSLGTLTFDLDGGGWRDWTSGRQDRHTTWRWAAGAGRIGQRTVGINVSTGMNGAGPGEDVVWWDGAPYPLAVDELTPTGDDPAGPWRVAGHDDTVGDWTLDFDPQGVRSASENLIVMRSRYVQPIGTFHGTLPTPEATLARVAAMPGVTEDHEAVW